MELYQLKAFDLRLMLILATVNITILHLKIVQLYMANSEGNRCHSVAKWDLPLPTDMAASSDPLVSRWEQTIFRISSR